jgi:catechol 2,3-dioxygenase-like lactoylglutathione lyase family enzyme
MAPDDASDAGPDLSVVDLDHVALRVSDLDRALDFYHGLLGLPVVDRDRFERDAVPYVGVAAGGRNLHLVPSDAGDRDDSGVDFDVGGEHVCLLLRSSETGSRAELEAVLDALKTAGVEVESGEPRERYGAYGRAWAAYVRDPDGRRVELKMH